jgi:hypothetical protein
VRHDDPAVSLTPGRCLQVGNRFADIEHTFVVNLSWSPIRFASSQSQYMDCRSCGANASGKRQQNRYPYFFHRYGLAAHTHQSAVDRVDPPSGQFLPVEAAGVMAVALVHQDMVEDAGILGVPEPNVIDALLSDSE